MKNYMVLVQDALDGPNRLVPMEWARGLDQAGLLSLMYMSHFGQITKVNACVRQLLVSFHGNYLWLDQKNYVDVELIAAIAWLPLASVDPTSFFETI